jgi:UDP-3-O-[3-hydroxymyristoyl] N-acetylglucosamine deacetylase
MQLYQQTIRRTVHAQGIGLHTGTPVDLALHPAPAGSGIRFLRADLVGSDPIVARASSILDTRMATTISCGAAFVSTTEHLLAALYAFGVDNVIVEVSGPEVPVFDGSASRFVEMIRDAGLRLLTAPRTYLLPLQTIEIKEGDKWIRLEPDSEGLFVDCSIEFAHPAIGAQTFQFAVDAENFSFAVASARTFGFLREVEAMQAAGLGLGGGLDNAVILDDTRVVNAEGLRFSNEFVRHKTLDLIGDLALAGFQILGRVTSYKSGHALNARLTQHLLEHPECWQRFTPAVPEPVFANA